ncbi:hypothetical protein BH09MYX1_BH09MYX1_55480 [soil metagenome]
MIHVVDANIGASKPLPIDDPIEVSFDRYLNPLTISRQSIALRDAFNQAPVNPTVSYDPVRRVVLLANPSEGQPWLIAGQPYKVIISAPTADNDLSLRAIDGAGLQATVTIGFFAAAPHGHVKDPTMSYCRDIQPILTACSGCHDSRNVSGGATWAGLVLDRPDGIEATAKGRVAQATNTGSRSVGGSPGATFGVDMPIIDSGSPGNSFLMYKLILGGRGTSGTHECTPAVVPTWDLTTSARDDAEAARLAELIPGRPMPYGESNPGLSDADLDRLRLWIAQGAPTETCTTSCSP